MRKLVWRLGGTIAVVACARAASFLDFQGPWFWIATLASFAAVVVALVRFSRARNEAKVTIGVDGVHIAGLASHEYVSYAEMHDVSLVGSKAAMIERRGHAPLVLELAPDVNGSSPATILLARFAEARSAHANEPRTPIEAALTRGERSAADWLRDLRGLTKHDGYREGIVAAEELWGIVENGALDVRKRAAATLALRDQLDEPGKARVRIAAHACASPETRETLEATLSDDDDAIANKLAKL